MASPTDQMSDVPGPGIVAMMKLKFQNRNDATDAPIPGTVAAIKAKFESKKGTKKELKNREICPELTSGLQTENTDSKTCRNPKIKATYRPQSPTNGDLSEQYVVHDLKKASSECNISVGERSDVPALPKSDYHFQIQREETTQYQHQQQPPHGPPPELPASEKIEPVPPPPPIPPPLPTTDRSIVSPGPLSDNHHRNLTPQQTYGYSNSITTQCSRSYTEGDQLTLKTDVNPRQANMKTTNIGLHNIPNAISPRNPFDPLQNLNSPNDKGVELFTKYKKKYEPLAFDENSNKDATIKLQVSEEVGSCASRPQLSTEGDHSDLYVVEDLKKKSNKCNTNVGKRPDVPAVPESDYRFQKQSQETTQYQYQEQPSHGPSPIIKLPLSEKMEAVPPPPLPTADRGIISIRPPSDEHCRNLDPQQVNGHSDSVMPQRQRSYTEGEHLMPKMDLDPQQANTKMANTGMHNKPNTVSPGNRFDPVLTFNSSNGRGGELFAKYKKKYEPLAVDENSNKDATIKLQVSEEVESGGSRPQLPTEGDRSDLYVVEDLKKKSSKCNINVGKRPDVPALSESDYRFQKQSQETTQHQYQQQPSHGPSPIIKLPPSEKMETVPPPPPIPPPLPTADRGLPPPPPIPPPLPTADRGIISITPPSDDHHRNLDPQQVYGHSDSVMPQRQRSYTEGEHLMLKMDLDPQQANTKTANTGMRNKPNTTSPGNHFDPVLNLNSSNGRGAELFAKYKKKYEPLDENSNEEAAIKLQASEEMGSWPPFPPNPPPLPTADRGMFSPQQHSRQQNVALFANGPTPLHQIAHQQQAPHPPVPPPPPLPTAPPSSHNLNSARGLNELTSSTSDLSTTTPKPRRDSPFLKTLMDHLGK